MLFNVIRKWEFFWFSFILFTSFSGHRPAQREWARTGLRSHTRCHPYPIPQPVKVDHTTGARPLLFSNSDVGSFTSHKNKSMKVLWDRTYSFSSLSEKTRKTNHLQMSLQSQHFLLSYLKTLRCWSGPGLSQGPPARQTGALPTELTRRRLGSDDTRDFRKRLWSRQGTRFNTQALWKGCQAMGARVRASEPCERKIEKVEKTVIRKKVNRKLTVVNESLTPKSPYPNP